MYFRVSDTLFPRPPILSKWSGLRGLVERAERRVEARGREAQRPVRRAEGRAEVRARRGVLEEPPAEPIPARKEWSTAVFQKNVSDGERALQRV